MAVPNLLPHRNAIAIVSDFLAEVTPSSDNPHRLGYAVIGGPFDPPKGFWFNPQGSWASRATSPGRHRCGEPIDLGSGNIFDQVTDYETAGQNKLKPVPLLQQHGVAGHVSPSAWGRTGAPITTAICISSIRPRSTASTAERPDGAVVNFASSAGTYTPDTDVDLKLTVSGSTWTLTDQNDTVETYTACRRQGDPQFHQTAQRLSSRR